MTHDQLAATANRSTELAPSLWHGSFRQQRPTRFDKRGNLTFVLTLKIMLWVTISIRKIIGGVVRHCDFVVKTKCEIYFLLCLSLIRENLCSRKFTAIRYAVLPRAVTARAMNQKLPKAALLTKD